MRALLAVLLISALTACGGGNNGAEAGPEIGDSPTTSDSSTADEACTRLARTWAVKAKALDTATLLAAEERVAEATDAMDDATDQIEIEGCSDSLLQSVLLGNYEAAVVAFSVHICVLHRNQTCQKAQREWQSKGARIVDQLLAK